MPKRPEYSHYSEIKICWNKEGVKEEILDHLEHTKDLISKVSLALKFNKMDSPESACKMLNVAIINIEEAWKRIDIL